MTLRNAELGQEYIIRGEYYNATDKIVTEGEEENEQ